MRLLCVLLPILSSLGTAQGAPPQEGARSRPTPPILLALDADGDGELSPAEIAQATAALRKLDKNGDGQLTPDEYRPPRPAGQDPEERGPRPISQAQDQRPSRQDGQGGRPDPVRPRPPLDVALDEDGDEVISAVELAKAPALLRKLDLNHDGRLSQDELRPKRAGRPGTGGGTERPEPRPGQPDLEERPAPTAPGGGRP